VAWTILDTDKEWYHGDRPDLRGFGRVCDDRYAALRRKAMEVRRIASFFKGLLLAGTGLVAACSGLPGLGSSSSGTDPAVIAASIDELKTDATWTAMTRAGDGVGARFALLESGAIPAAKRLVKAGKDATFDLEMDLFESPTAADEEARVTQAWILGKIGDKGSLTALGLGLSQSMDLGLFQAANAEADAAFGLLGDSRRNVRDHWYELADLEAAHAAAADTAPSAGTAVTSAATAATSSSLSLRALSYGTRNRATCSRTSASTTRIRPRSRRANAGSSSREARAAGAIPTTKPR